ncbi:acetyl-CoA carboxylase biotin carboxyl carrier protein [Thalassoroseus pseudoceratinae]|uniref:acetyl-CoA carboxylase biotin carboxyl carrier protein n=1 Tax=Thalassoroseus pseudoceratinae TaxID=2713176 RepID=UPI001422E4B1|nr:acetyl-CoA carboxylase biotin carboxyl carrier protein [Thalassoroseus pseudoceratinae]
MDQEHNDSPQASESGSFDLDKLRELVEMMEKHELTEVSLRRGRERWHLKRGPQEVYQTTPAAFATPAPAPAAPAPTPAASAPAAGEAEPAKPGMVIKAEAVGTFYTAASPDDPPFVQVGSRVEPDTTVCLIEAMKVFNQIPAGLSGTIAEVLVENGEAVEYGTPLFRVTP